MSKPKTTDEKRLELLGYLRLFVRDGLCTEQQKAALRRAKWIDHKHGSWGLSDEGRAEAELRGYL